MPGDFQVMAAPFHGTCRFRLAPVLPSGSEYGENIHISSLKKPYCHFGKRLFQGHPTNRRKHMEQTMKAAEEELLNTELARRFRGGVIMDVVNPEQARIAEEAGACAVMALERVPSDIRAAGGVARMSDPGMIREIKAAVSIPVMAKCRIGHFVEARVLEAVDVDYIDESEVLTPADEEFHIDKTTFRTPFVCGCRNLGEALRRIAEGASMIRTKGEAGTGDVVEAVRHARCVTAEIRRVQVMPAEELVACAKEMGAPVELLRRVKALGRLPVLNFAAGGVATPADAALMMQLGMDGVFVGSGIFKSGDPARRAKAIVAAVAHHDDPRVLAEVSENLGPAMPGMAARSLPDEEQMSTRGW